jgi:hypothetical protein
MHLQSREASLRKAMPVVCRAVVTAPETRLYASDGAAITPALRDAMLAKCAAGEFVSLSIDLLAYEQRPGVANRRHVRFSEAAMSALGASGVGMPFLRDHAQEDSLSRAGTITRSTTEQLAGGGHAIRMTAVLTAPWAVDLALRGLLGGVSIGWAPTGPIECSACAAPVLTKCYHLPGDTIAGANGASARAEWVFTSAELTECSVCNVPAVQAAGVEQVRAALSAAFSDTPISLAHRAGTDSGTQHEEPTMTMTAEQIAAANKLAVAGAQAATDACMAACQAACQTCADACTAADATPESCMAACDACTAACTEACKVCAEACGTVPAAASAMAAKALSAATDRRVEVRANKLAAERAANLAMGRQLATSLGLDQAAVEKIVTTAKTFTEAKLSILAAAADPKRTTSVSNHHQVDVGAEATEKLYSVLHAGFAVHLAGKDSPALRAELAEIGVKHDDPEVKRASRLSMMDLAETLFESRGGDSRQLRGMSRLERVQVLMGARRDHVAVRTLSGTGDLSTLVGAALRTYTKQRYTERVSAWKLAAKKINLPDFESTKAIGGGNFPPLLDVPENGKYEMGGVTESDYDVRLAKGGRIFPVSWELILADRWGRIQQLADDRVTACLRYENRKFKAMIEANKMADGTTDLFSVGHANIAASTGTPSFTTLQSGRKAMGKQKGELGLAGEPDALGDYLSLEPKFWILGIDDKATAEAFLGPGYVPTSSGTAPTNSMRGLIDGLIQEPFLDDQSPVFSILVADPNEIVSIQYGYLDGAEGPDLTEEDGFTTDGKNYKVRLPFYVAAVDHRGLVQINRS